MDKSRLKKALKTFSGIYTEIDLQSRISHPNIIQLLYVNESKTKFDLVMEYASKGSLFDFIRKNHHLSEDLSFSIFIQVVNAVYFLQIESGRFIAHIAILIYVFFVLKSLFHKMICLMDGELN